MRQVRAHVRRHLSQVRLSHRLRRTFNLVSVGLVRRLAKRVVDTRVLILQIAADRGRSREIAGARGSSRELLLAHRHLVVGGFGVRPASVIRGGGAHPADPLLDEVLVHCTEVEATLARDDLHNIIAHVMGGAWRAQCGG